MPSVEVTRTWLELPDGSPLTAPASPPHGTTLLRTTCSVERYRALYQAVGGDVFWWDRLAWSDAELAAYLAGNEIAVWILVRDRRDIGYFELRLHDDGSVEIAYFGLAASARGEGLGRFLLEQAIAAAAAMRPARIWLHTCTLDHPAALPNYLARGFQPYRMDSYTVDVPDA